ncbi:hypothetical protein [Sphingobacterium sp.]|uniref:hypothetical protein n=1 Tax=Sphingobacterium sp. TaxID=341027 RepID=UPI0031DAB7AC
MDTAEFDHLPDGLKEKIIRSRQAFLQAQDISDKISGSFHICNLSVSATADHAISISGITDNEDEKIAVQNFVLQMENVSSVFNGIEVLSNPTALSLVANGKEFSITTLVELKTVVVQFHETEFVEYTLSGHDESSIILLKNSTHSFAIYLRFNGDAGYTTHNPKGTTSEMKDFILTNGQRDEYPTALLVDNKDGLEILQFYLLTGEMYPGIKWQEE